MDITAKTILHELVEQNGSDLHIAANNPPVIRIHGSLKALAGHDVFDAVTIEDLVRQMTGDKGLNELTRTGDLDAAITIEGGHRLRINAYREQGGYALALRLLPSEFFSFERLGLPIKVLDAIRQLHSGLVLVTGATSSGKSTTIASIVHRINQERPCHILTIEDPIEYRHNSQTAFVTQREIGRDTASFAEALRRAMREDPDVIVVGEMRDMETMAAALTLAETGHLTFATLHTSSAIQTVSRVISAFPATQQAQIRIQLATTLQYVICQKLVPWDDGGGRSLAAEILALTPAVRAMIRDEKTHQIKTAMQTNFESGMRTLNQSLEDLITKKRIGMTTALRYSEEKQELKNGNN